MESSLSWNNTFSPNTPAGATPGKLPYFTDLDHLLQQQQQTPPQHQQQQQQQHQHQQREGATPNGQASILHNDTPSNFTDLDQMFLHHLEHNLYDEGNPANTHESRDHGSTATPSGPGSLVPSGGITAGSTPIDPSTYTHHHVHVHHHHHPQSNENTPNSHGSHEPINVANSSTATPVGHTPGTFVPHAHANSSQGAPPPPSQFYEFGLENMNFIIPEDLDFDADPSQPQTAYPPLAHPPVQTPSMLAANKAKVNEKRFDSPILPSQNERSYNNQHFYHKHLKSTDPLAYPPGTSASHAAQSAASAPHQHVRPEAVFTPLVSPAVTPLDSQVNMNKPPFGQPPVQASFEPLTSPALNAQNSCADRRRTSSSAFVDEQHYQVSGATPAAPYHKRRTPLSTPVLQANNANSNGTSNTSRHNSSPSLKGVRNTSGSFKSSPKTPFERLPESSMDSANTTPMLPPQGKKVGITTGGSTNGNAPLMGFTMGRLAEHSQTDDSEMDPEMDFDLDKSKGSRTGKLSRTSSFRGKARSSSTSSTEASPKLRNLRAGSTSEDGSKRGEKPVTKKASHKLAEQGRRNRMNTAVQELGLLVPKTYHEEVTIPSKATTVELASNYIRDLLDEIDRLKGHREEVKKEG